MTAEDDRLCFNNLQGANEARQRGDDAGFLMLGRMARARCSANDWRDAATLYCRETGVFCSDIE